MLLFCCQLVPIENLNGRKRVEAGDLCERRNGNHLLSLKYMVLLMRLYSISSFITSVNHRKRS